MALRAVLDAARWPGTGLRSVLDEVAGSSAVRSTGDQLRRRALLAKHSHLTRAGRKLREELDCEVREGLRIAVLGPGDVDEELRDAPKEPDLPPGPSAPRSPAGGTATRSRSWQTFPASRTGGATSPPPTRRGPVTLRLDGTYRTGHAGVRR